VVVAVSVGGILALPGNQVAAQEEQDNTEHDDQSKRTQVRSKSIEGREALLRSVVRETVSRLSGLDGRQDSRSNANRDGNNDELNC